MVRGSVDGHRADRHLLLTVHEKEKAVAAALETALVTDTGFDRVLPEALVAEARDFRVLQPAQIPPVDVTWLEGPQEQAIRGELHNRAMIETV